MPSQATAGQIAHKRSPKRERPAVVRELGSPTSWSFGVPGSLRFISSEQVPRAPRVHVLATLPV